MFSPLKSDFMTSLAHRRTKAVKLLYSPVFALGPPKVTSWGLGRVGIVVTWPALVSISCLLAANCLDI